MEKRWKVGSEGEGRDRRRKGMAKDGRGEEEGERERVCEDPTITARAAA